MIPSSPSSRTALCAALVSSAAVLALPARAAVVVDATAQFAQVAVELGLGASQVTVNGIDQNPVVAHRHTTLPVFTPPRGGPTDTLFQPSTVNALQRAEGLNATAVSGAFANGLTHNRLEASTSWTLEGHVVPQLLLPFDLLALDYLLFPGDIGLSRFGDYDAEAGISYRIVLDEFQQNRLTLESEIVLTRTAGSLAPSLRVSGALATAGLTVGTRVVDGISYDTVHTDALHATQFLGTFPLGASISLTYLMNAWVRVPGFETAGFARLGDPFALEADPAAEVARAFPGLTRGAFTISALPTTGAVPAPTPLALLAAAALPWLARRRRRA